MQKQTSHGFTLELHKTTDSASKIISGNHCSLSFCMETNKWQLHEVTIKKNCMLKIRPCDYPIKAATRCFHVVLFAKRQGQFGP